MRKKYEINSLSLFEELPLDLLVESEIKRQVQHDDKTKFYQITREIFKKFSLFEPRGRKIKKVSRHRCRSYKNRI